MVHMSENTPQRSTDVAFETNTQQLSSQQAPQNFLKLKNLDDFFDNCIMHL